MQQYPQKRKRTSRRESDLLSASHWKAHRRYQALSGQGLRDLDPSISMGYDRILGIASSIEVFSREKVDPERASVASPLLRVLLHQGIIPLVQQHHQVRRRARRRRPGLLSLSHWKGSPTLRAISGQGFRNKTRLPIPTCRYHPNFNLPGGLVAHRTTIRCFLFCFLGRANRH
jgi:hypothetical protein